MKAKETFWVTVITVLCIVCFPANPLVLTGLIETEHYTPLIVLGSLIWIIGMALVMSPMVMFRRHGGVPKGKSYVSTTKLVDTGIYAAVRHPQYLGGILSIFIATPLFYPHWLFIVLGIPGSLITYLSTRWEDERMIERFGAEYEEYMQRVPPMNLVLGIIRVWGRRKNK